jgi:GH25 family lysozyme M1 (1,4-beta-N-acetylmuramidase)
LNKEDEVPDAIEEAKFFLKTISSLPKSDLPLVLDIESMNPKVDLDPKEVLAYINAFFGHLAINGHEYALYSYTPFLDGNLPLDHNLSDVKLWIAQYNNKPYPRMPRGWTKYWIWQYSGDTGGGRVTGIPNVVDLNKSETTIFA